ncbi:MAG: MerR family transcriptional regulator [Candidatus Eisenbacteria bacterium]|nr:MerR family transcriptional regulator [Candidatus Eisenbacteria bacterium]
MAEERTYSIQELVQASGVPRRTVRYYVQLGLIPAPEGAGRGHYYRDEHLRRLIRLREWQDQGRSLEEIRAAFAGESSLEESALPIEVELTMRIRIGPGMELFVSGEGVPPTAIQVRALARAAAEILRRNHE